MVLRKDQLEVQLKDEHQLIQSGILRDESPLDRSPEFQKLCDACRVGDLKGCQEAITTGVNINARDIFDYTPLILASLCGHYEVVQLLLESGALCERDTFQGERCLYNALNNRIRNLLLSYDYSKSTDLLQPLASHILSLLTRQKPITADICLTTGMESWNLHKFVLSARSPYFEKKLAIAPDTATWKLANTIPPEAFQIALRYLYLGDVPSDLGLSNKSFVSEEEVFKGIDKVSKQLEIESLWDGIANSDRRIVRQRHQDEVTRGRDQIEAWYQNNVLKHKIYVDTNKVKNVKWNLDNGIFADILLCADEERVESGSGEETPKERNKPGPLGIPIGPSISSRSPSASRKPCRSVLYPAHRAMLLRSEYFQTMFTSAFLEAQMGEYLRIVRVDCSPEVLQIILDFLYTETAYIPLSLALDVLYAADMLFIDKLKTKAAVTIATIGNGNTNLSDRTHIEGGEVEVEAVNIYDVIRAAWDLKVQRLEEFSARYLAYRLEDYVDEQDFEDLIKESAERIEKRQETDSIELLDDIRYYLSERFRLAFEDAGLEEIMDEDTALADATSGAAPESSQQPPGIEKKEDIPSVEQANVHEIRNDARSTGDQAAIEASSSIQQPRTLNSDTKPVDLAAERLMKGQIRALNGNIAEDEYSADAMNHEILLAKIDSLLERLKLDA